MASNPFTRIHLTPRFALGHLIQWDIDPLFRDHDPHLFTLEVSGILDFSELIREIPVGNSFFASDIPGAQQLSANVLYYRVRLETPEGTYHSKSISSYFTNYTRRQYVLAAEIARKEMLRMKKFSGVDAVVLKRKIYGEPVTGNTVDPVTGMALTSGAPHHGSSIVAGYYKPLHTLYSVEEGNDTRRIDPGGTGALEVSQISVRMLGFPALHYNDIVIDYDQDYRYIVKDRQEVEFPGTSITIIQKLQLSLIPPSDPVYSININE